jgi:DNA (cytosine-5)-methyltransferase 1
MTHGSLFSGIGGFDLAAEWVGWDNIFHCEYNPFAQKVLKHHFPNSKLYEDVRTFDATAYAGRIDIISGGFPCQPFSAAGKRKGTQDERHLWPEMLRIIHEVAPSYVVGENVRGLINWNGGLVFEEVCADLEAAGYEVTPYLLPACGKNAPHRRDRIWFIAYKGDAKQRTAGVSRRSEPNHLVSQEAGKSSQLNPLFVEEMMGFPKNWTLSPFRTGEKNL